MCSWEARRVEKSFFAQDTLWVAQALIGKYLCLASDAGLRVGRIVETEAYQGPEDLAAHSAGGRRTPRTEVMFGLPGHAYVYLIYGVWHCLNFVTRERDVPHAVLLRAIEPTQNIVERTNGPGLLCRSLGINLKHNGLPLDGDKLWIAGAEQGFERAPDVRTSPRIGIGERGAFTDVQWRFYDATSRHVSGRVAKSIALNK
jgi:DNA-3-methyladenine glycosylase